MRGYPIPEVSGTQLYNWAIKLTSYLRVMERELETPSPKTIQLEHAKANASAAKDGVMMWDSVAGGVIVAKDGAWHLLSMTPVTVMGKKDNITR